MRTDVKVGLICLFAIVLGVVIYFVAEGNAHPRDAKADAGQTTLTSGATAGAAVKPADKVADKPVRRGACCRRRPVMCMHLMRW